MITSESINELAAALAKAQGDISGAKKDSENPHFRSKYADLASVWDAIRAPFAANGLSVTQFPRLAQPEQSDMLLIEVETCLMHTSGQFMRDTLRMPVGKPDAHGVGSALTYARRYALSAITGVAPEDDDANGAVAGQNSHRDEQPGNPAVIIKIKDVLKSQTTAGKDKFKILGSDGNTYSTITKAHAEIAKSAKEAALFVDLVYKQSSYGKDVVAIAEREATLDDPLL
jgi:hypothetical protein